MHELWNYCILGIFRAIISNADEIESCRKYQVANPIGNLATGWAPWQQTYDHFIIIPTTPEHFDKLQTLISNAPWCVSVNKKAKKIGDWPIWALIRNEPKWQYKWWVCTDEMIQKKRECWAAWTQQWWMKNKQWKRCQINLQKGAGRWKFH